MYRSKGNKIFSTRGIFYTSAALIVFCLSPLSLHGQKIKIVPRAVLDSIANPQTAREADVLKTDKNTADIGRVREDAKPNSVDFRLTNEGGVPVVITRIQTSCSCVSAVKSGAEIAKGGSVTITVTFNPKGRLGMISQRVFVYTSLSDRQPSVVLNLQGEVIWDEDIAAKYPFAMGGVRLEKRRIPVAYDAQTDVMKGSVEVINTGDAPVTLTADNEFTIPGVEIVTLPVTMAKGQTGKMFITVYPERLPDAVRNEKSISVLVAGVNLPPSKRTIFVELENKK